MAVKDLPAPSEISAPRIGYAAMREPCLVRHTGTSKAQLLAAPAGFGVTRITVDRPRIIPALGRLCEATALTRNDSRATQRTGS